MKLLLTLCLLGLTTITFAKGPVTWAKIDRIKGNVTFNGKKLTKDSQIQAKGTIKTGPSSFIKVTVMRWKNSIVIGPNSEMKLIKQQDGESKLSKHMYSFIKGSCRWISNKKAKEHKGKLHTKNAVFGVRGTDYIVIANPLLGETEIVVLDGAVNFTNKNNKKDQALIKKGQWGGLGGRFGNSIGKVLSLPKNVIKHFDQKLKY